jgi:hypothetical protein
MGLTLFPYGNPSPPMVPPEYDDAASPLRDARRRHQRCALEPHDAHAIPRTTSHEVGFYHAETLRFAGEAWHGKRCVLTKLAEQLRVDSRRVRTLRIRCHAGRGRRPRLSRCCSTCTSMAAQDRGGAWGKEV